MDSKERRTEVLRLLTGWESGGISQSGEDEKASFASLTRHQVFRYTLFDALRIISLGSIGASEALWYEWENSAMRGKSRAEIFAIAFLLAKHPKHALSVLKSHYNKNVHTDTEGDPEPASAADIVEESTEAIGQDGRHEPDQKELLTFTLESVSRKALHRYYRSHGLVFTNRALRRIDEIFSGGPEHILKVLDNFLVLEWIESNEKRDAPVTQGTIDWVQQDGVGRSCSEKP